MVGLLVGSFANVLIDRLPRGESVLWGRSRCDHCKKTLRWYELIPVVSYMIQLGRCRRCHKRLSVQYPIVEIAAGIGFASLFVGRGMNGVVVVPLLVLFLSFLVILVADFKYQIIPDSMLVLAGVGITLNLLVHHAPVHTWLSLVATGAVSFGAFYILWAATRGRGLGFGDVKLALIMGTLLGFPGVMIAFYVAFLTGAGWGVILMMTGKKTWKSKIAFGPFLVLGTVVSWVFGPDIIAIVRMFV